MLNFERATHETVALESGQPQSFSASWVIDELGWYGVQKNRPFQPELGGQEV